MPKVATPKLGLRASTTRTLSFGLVKLGISLAPAVDDSSRVSAKLLDPTALTPLHQQYVNDSGDVVPHADRAKGYAYGDGFVVLAGDEVPKLDNESTIDIAANVAATAVPSEWVTKTYLAWPTDATHEEAYGLVSHYLRLHGRAFIGNTTMSGTTKTLAVRWSDLYGCLIAQTLTYYSQVRWANVEKVAGAVQSIPDADPRMAGMAEALFGGMTDQFDWSEVEDEYGDRLEAAVREKGENGTVSVSPRAVAESKANDLMSALAASLEAVK